MTGNIPNASHKKSKWVLFLPLVVFVALAGIFMLALKSDPSLLPSAKLDKTLPPFRLPGLLNAEEMITHTDIRGPALFNVWATWCPSCQVEHPTLVKLAGFGIPIYGLNYKDVRSAASKYLEIHGNPYIKNVFDEAGDLGLDMGVYGAPETFLIDANGIIRHRHVGVVDEKAWREVIWPLWQAMGGFDPMQGKS